MRVTKLSAAAMLLAGAAFCGWHGAAKADQTNAKVRMVQQTDQSAPQGGTSVMDRAQQGAQQDAQSATDQMNRMGGAQSAGGATLPQGVTPKDLGKAEDVRKTFAAFTRHAGKRDSFKDTTDFFVKSDRERLRDGGEQTSDAWNQAVDHLDQAWKSKYNKNFDVHDHDKAYDDRYLTVQQGKIEDPKAITHWPVAPMTNRAQEYESVTASPNLNKGTDIALGTLQGTGNEPALTASLIREGMDWKIDIPDNVTANEIQASIARHLEQVVSMKDQWPSDPDDAARVVTYHLLQACYTAGLPGADSSSQGSTSIGSQGGSSTEHQGHGAMGSMNEENKSGSTSTPSSATPGQSGTSSNQMSTTSSQSGNTSEDQGEGSMQDEE